VIISVLIFLLIRVVYFDYCRKPKRSSHDR
jgi:hypothetical protein